MKLKKRTIGVVQDFLVNSILHHYTIQRGHTIDLGAGSGALAIRLWELGFENSCD